jgi:hypothetical protein
MSVRVGWAVSECTDGTDDTDQGWVLVRVDEMAAGMPEVKTEQPLLAPVVHTDTDTTSLPVATNARGDPPQPPPPTALKILSAAMPPTFEIGSTTHVCSTGPRMGTTVWTPTPGTEPLTICNSRRFAPCTA